MVKLLLSASIGAALGARVQETDNDLHSYLSETFGKANLTEADVDWVSGVVDKHWPDSTPDNRRMKASQLLQLHWGSRRRKSTAAETTKAPPAQIAAAKPACTDQVSGSCTPLDQLCCKGDVQWAFQEGKHQDWAGEAYYDLPAYTGSTIGTASLEDWHKFFHCTSDSKCAAPPCTCSHPPCDVCKKKDPSQIGSNAMCHAHTYCVGREGDCCPNAEGVRDACCDFKPKLGAAKPVTEHRATVPAEEVQRSLHGGHYLGPLKETTCENGQELQSASGKMLHECPDICESLEECKLFTYKDNTCSFFSTCTPVASGDARMLFVKNIEKMSPHWLPARQISGGNHHFFVIGDWGSESCPQKASMHYVFPAIKQGDAKWETDHNAQRTVAQNMGTVGQQVKPFMVLNAGDNFYWGGVFPKMLGGKGIHDTTSWVQGFENVYTDPSLVVPWLGIMGNHDYGGDGCFSDIRAQFDYTIKDMLVNNRWKVPSPYYNHRVDFDGYSAEYFMLDTNIEDASSGRHGGICAQKICLETMGRVNIPVEKCKAWFSQQWSEQKAWFDKSLAASTANWKIVVMHHKPHGQVAGAVHPGVKKHGVQMMVGSHTHELAFYEKWGNTKTPLLVVGAGGGAQSAPGCGDARYCSGPHEYGFADVEIGSKQLTMRLYRHDMAKVLQTNICSDGSVQDADCSGGFVPTTTASAQRGSPDDVSSIEDGSTEAAREEDTSIQDGGSGSMGSSSMGSSSTGSSNMGSSSTDGGNTHERKAATAKAEAKKAGAVRATDARWLSSAVALAGVLAFCF